MKEAAFQQCINPACNATYAVEDVHLSCTKCGSLLDIKYDWSKLPVPKNLNFFEHRWSTKGTGTEGRLDFSGVWRFRELLPFFFSGRPDLGKELVLRYAETPCLSGPMNQETEDSECRCPQGSHQALLALDRL